MSFIQAIKTGFKKYFTVSGRANRREFWYWIAFVSLSLCLALIIDGAILGPALSEILGHEDVMAFDQDASNPLSLFLLAIYAFPTLTAAVRRMHDSDISGWWLLIAFTGVGLLPLAYFFVKGAKKGENRFND
ncbi:MAG: DUF805 domain-containing protein [Rhizobiaceae bacterium]